MEIKELRIGNFVHHKAQWSHRNPGIDYAKFKRFDFQIALCDFYALAEDRMWENDIEPIPLSEKWLIKFGFTQEDCLFHLNFITVKLLNKSTNHWIVYFNHVLIIECFNLPVHRVQNIYFAIYGCELQLLLKQKKSAINPVIDTNN
jgi:hypothetical protein